MHRLMSKLVWGCAVVASLAMGAAFGCQFYVARLNTDADWWAAVAATLLGLGMSICCFLILALLIVAFVELVDHVTLEYRARRAHRRRPRLVAPPRHATPAPVVELRARERRENGDSA
jgi:hypothetical protein